MKALLIDHLSPMCINFHVLNRLSAGSPPAMSTFFHGGPYHCFPSTANKSNSILNYDGNATYTAIEL